MLISVCAVRFGIWLPIFIMSNQIVNFNQLEKGKFFYAKMSESTCLTMQQCTCNDNSALDLRLQFSSSLASSSKLEPASTYNCAAASSSPCRRNDLQLVAYHRAKLERASAESAAAVLEPLRRRNDLHLLTHH